MRSTGCDDADQRAVLGHQHVAATRHRAARQKDGQRARLRIGGAEAALLAHVPVQFHGRRALEQHRRQAAALRHELVDDKGGSGHVGLVNVGQRG